MYINRWMVNLAAALASLTVLGGLFACTRPTEKPAKEAAPIRVVVSIPPLAGLVGVLVPEGSEVLVLVEAGQSPHGYEPRPSDIAAIGRADLVVLVGMGMEFSLPASVREGPKVLEMAEALGLESEDSHEHAGHDHAHCSGDADPHLWLDPVLVAEFVPMLAERVRGAAQAAGMDASALAVVDEREATLLVRVRAIDTEYHERLKPFADTAIITQHTAWSRLAARYGLVIAEVIQVVEEAEPSPGHVAEVVTQAGTQRVRAVFTEVQLDARLTERVAAQLGVPVGRLDPLGQGDWEGMMRANLDELVSVFQRSHEPDVSDTEPVG